MCYLNIWWFLCCYELYEHVSIWKIWNWLIICVHGIYLNYLNIWLFDKLWLYVYLYDTCICTWINGKLKEVVTYLSKYCKYMNHMEYMLSGPIWSTTWIIWLYGPKGQPHGLYDYMDRKVNYMFTGWPAKLSVICYMFPGQWFG